MSLRCLLFSLLACLSVPLFAGDFPVGKPGPKSAEFANVFDEWKKLIAQLGDLKVQYANATDAGKKADIAKQYKVLYPQAKTQLDKLIASAQAAYAEAPNADKQVTELLESILSDCTYRIVNGHPAGSDDYERGFPIAKLLIDNKDPNPYLADQAGIAAFCCNDFDLADTYFKQAKELNRLDAIGQKDFDDIGYYKEAWAKEKQVRAAEEKANDLPRVLLKTTAGDIELELFENEAPNTVLNFIVLVDKGFYKDVTFHRVLPGFMAQGGDPKGDGTGGPGYKIPDECHRPDHRVHLRGVISMAKEAAPDTGGSQFFLNFVPTHHLDGLHTVFGRIVSGMDVLAKLHPRNPEDATQGETDKIIEAKVTRRRKHPYDEKDLKKIAE